MALNSKLASDRNHKALMELIALPGNDICADCKSRNPRWTSHNLGIFICMNCASIHRKIGTHITKVKSVTMDTWTKDQVDTMRNMGNIKSNGIYNPNELRNPPPPNLEDGERDSEMEQYIRAKYEYRKYIDRSALVASKLGPSRSSTSMPRSASSPLTTNARSSTLPSSSTATSSKPTGSPLTNSQTVSQNPVVPASKLNVQPRSVSQPVPPQNPPQATPVSQGGVWDDLIQLQDKPTSSTLPLQYQQQPAASPLSLGLSGGPTGLTQGPLLTGSPMSTPPVGLGINPFQQLQFQSQLATTPSFAPSASPFTPSLPLNQNLQLSTPSYGQQLFMNQTGMATGTPQSSQFYQPQPQTASLPLQTPTPQGFLTPSPSQGMMSAPVTQTQFMTPSPSQQFLSHSPQPQFQAQPTGTPQQTFMTPSPQPVMGMGGMQSYSPGPGMMAGQFGVGGMVQQPQFQMQQQQQQGQFLQGLPDQMLSPANFQAAGGMNRNPFAPQHRGTF